VIETLGAVTRGGGSGWLLPGWSRGDVLALAGVIVAAVGVIIAIVPASRHFVQRLWRSLHMRAGFPHHLYAKWFTGTWGTYENPYLGEEEKLDLLSTYVPLSFQSDDSPQNVAIATTVLTQLPADRLIIVGDPGSGKSTLLKAYGVGIVRSRHILAPRRQRVVPYFVQLRKLAKFLAADKGIAEYITGEILVRQGVMRPDRAREFFSYTLERRQAVVMLDGLDEVSDDKQRAVLSAVRDFVTDKTQGRPTAQAKVLLTCRNAELREPAREVDSGRRQARLAVRPGAAARLGDHQLPAQVPAQVQVGRGPSPFHEVRQGLQDTRPAAGATDPGHVGRAVRAATIHDPVDDRRAVPVHDRGDARAAFVQARRSR